MQCIGGIPAYHVKALGSIPSTAKMKEGRKEQGVNLIKVPHMHVWGYYNEAPLYN
jgi:hypothetical protein